MPNIKSVTPWKPVPILMYHAVEDAPRAPLYKHLYVTASEFAVQMQMLKTQGYQAISFETLGEALLGKAQLPAKPVILTFDDGYANLLTNAMPVLNALEFAYTVFLVSERIGKTNDWVIPEGMEPTPLLTWHEIRKMRSDSPWVSFQPHTVNHPHLAKIPISEAKYEMLASKNTLEQELQTPMTVFCYPYGSVNAAVAQTAGDIGYTMAVTTQFGRVRIGDNLLQLPRISIYHVPPVSLTYGIGSLNFRWRVESRRDTR